MITDEALEKVRGWFTGRLPKAWTELPPTITVDREEVIVMLTLPDVELAKGASDNETTEARAGRAKAFREETRDQRIRLASEAERRYDRKVSWGVQVGDYDEMFTSVAAPVMTRLRQPQRQILDTLVEAGVARSRSDALAWCVRLVGQHEGDWLADLRDAMTNVIDVRAKGPAA